MKNIIKCTSYYLLIKLSSIAICIISTAGFLNAQNQRTVNINNESSFQNLIRQENDPSLKSIFTGNVENVRPFEYNPQLKIFTPKNQGDILLLDFFDGKKYTAIVQKVTVSYDGITGITAKILDTEFGYCYISVSEKGISMSADIPGRNEQFFISTKNGKSYLSQYKMSELKNDELGCADVDIPESDSSKHEHAGMNTASFEDIVSDASDCTFPPDDLSDSITVNVLIVYTEKARQWALSYYGVTDIDDLIDQAMQRSNTAMENSLTNITFTLAYKYKTDYVEINSSNDLYNLAGSSDGYMDEVHNLRKQYKADLVMLIPEVDFTGGLAYLLNYYIPGDGLPNYGFGLSRVQQSSWTYTLVHEMGHNMGCGHHWKQTVSPGPGLFSYSSGYRWQDASSAWYSTIMTYEAGNYFVDGNYAPRIAFFSDPNIIHGGVNIGDAVNANNALTLRQSKHAVSRYSDYFVPGLKCLSVNQGILSPVFHTDTVAYTVTVPSNVSTITVYATPSHPSSTILTGTGQHPLACGSNIITVTVRTPTLETKSYTINVIRTCQVTVSPSDTAICAGSSATLNAHGESGAIFKWYNSQTGGTLLHTGNSYTVYPASTTHYYVSQTISGTESNRVEATVTVNPLPNAPVANSVTACYDGNIHTGGASSAGIDESVVWYTAASGGTVTSSPERSTVGTATAYAAARNNTTNCESSTRTEVSVTVYAVYDISINETICTGESYFFNGNSYTATGIYTANLLSVSGCDSIVTLTLVVLQSCNPQVINVDNDYYELTYGDNPFTFMATASSGLPLTFSVSGTSVDVQNISASQYSVTVQNAGITVITLQQAGDYYFAEEELSVTVMVNPAELTIKANDYTVSAGDAFPVLGYACSGFVYGEDSTVLTKFPVISCAVANTNITGTYSVIINGAEAYNYTIKYINGILNIKERMKPLPNAFTPNQDGINDIFGDGYELRIFNRWGIQLYEGSTGWDGRYKGKMVSPGVYYYLAKDSNGNEYKGTVMLIKQ
ncbi:MAG: gliding motility-associated C-terminal domain-containing protein [Prevotellaceae bacterium]|jgi:gliding motility-associated-like protein|nr:gliding motility-associated C-terminal domain-containing protein [Prevotellaceae bacterium]